MKFIFLSFNSDSFPNSSVFILSSVRICDVLPSGLTKYYKNDTELTLISTIYTELTA